ncbi:MAG TPA: hypothetical protein VID95_10550 [Candidatus Limnocylindrales bacterium]|jgi:hypothetical protein
MTESPGPSVLRLEVPIVDDDDRRILRGALLKARATELSELQRRAGRHNLGYGTDSARESMDDETRSLRRRIELLDALIVALDPGT